MGKKKKEAALIAEARERGFFDYPHKWDNLTETRPVCTGLEYKKCKGSPYLCDNGEGNVIWWADQGWATVIKDDKDKLIEEAKRRFPIGTKFICKNTLTEATIKFCIFKTSSGVDDIGINEIDSNGDYAVTNSAYHCIYYRGKWAEIIPEKKKPIFTTEDGVDVFEGDSYYFISYFGSVVPSEAHVTNLTDGTKRFSTQQAAQDWIEKQKPALLEADLIKEAKERGLIDGATYLSPKNKFTREVKYPLSLTQDKDGLRDAKANLIFWGGEWGVVIPTTLKSLKPEELVEGEIYFAEENSEAISSIFRHKYSNLNKDSFYEGDRLVVVLSQQIRPATLLEKQKLITTEISHNYFHELRNQK